MHTYANNALIHLSYVFESSVLLAPSQNLLTRVMDTAEEDDMRPSPDAAGRSSGRHQRETASPPHARIRSLLNRLVERLISCTQPSSAPSSRPGGRLTVMRNHGSILLPTQEPNLLLFLSHASNLSLAAAVLFSHESALRWLYHRSWWGKRESGGQPCGITNRLLFLLWQFLRELARCLRLSAQGTEAAHEPWHYDTEKSSVSTFEMSFAHSRHPGGWTTRLCGSLIHVWPNTSRWDLFPGTTLEPGWTHRSRHPKGQPIVSVLVIGGGFSPELVTRAASGAASDTPTQHLGFSGEDPMQVGEHSSPR